MPGIRKDGTKLLNSAQGFGDAVYDAFANFWKKDGDAAIRNTERASQRLVSRAAAKADMDIAAATRTAAAAAPLGGVAAESAFFKVVKAPFKWALTAGTKLVDWPVGLLILKPANAIVKGATSLFVNYRRAAPIALVGGIAAYTANRYSHKQSEALEQNFAAAQQNMAMQAMAAQPPVSYMNSVPPELSAELSARQAAGKDGQGVNHTAAVTASQAQAAAPAV